MSRNTQLLLFFSAVVCFMAAVNVHESTFNNFLSDTFGMTAEERGRLEFPRELPGLLVVAMTGVLCALPVARVGVIGAGTFAVGMVGMALFGFSKWPMVAMMIVGSAGMHLLMPVRSAIAIGLSGAHNRGRNMGLMGMFGNIGVIAGTGLVWLGFGWAGPQYRIAFLCAGGAACVAGVLYAMLRIPDLHQPRARAVFRRRYGLYYVLELLFGARKQIFVTFGPWVLIKVYGEPATEIAFLFLIAAVVGIVFKPLVGMAIDAFGERAVMIFDGVALAFVCIGYGYAAVIGGSLEGGRSIACACFIIDNLLFALGTSRAVYVSRLTDSPQELTSTLAMGVSVNHVVSMLVPTLAGAMWTLWGYQVVFVAAAVLALTISAVSSFVPGRQSHVAQQ